METFTRFRALIKLEHITLQERKHLPRALVTPLKSHKQNSNIWKEPCRLTAFLKTCWAINLQSQKELDSASHDKPVYLRNRIENRVSKQQYQANFPVEDYMCDEQLKELDGYLMAVFDGHGGSELVLLLLPLGRILQHEHRWLLRKRPEEYTRRGQQIVGSGGACTTRSLFAARK